MVKNCGGKQKRPVSLSTNACEEPVHSHIEIPVLVIMVEQCLQGTFINVSYNAARVSPGTTYVASASPNPMHFSTISACGKAERVRELLSVVTGESTGPARYSVVLHVAPAKMAVSNTASSAKSNKGWSSCTSAPFSFAQFEGRTSTKMRE